MQVLVEPFGVFSDTTLMCMTLLFEVDLLGSAMILLMLVLEHVRIVVGYYGI